MFKKSLEKMKTTQIRRLESKVGHEEKAERKAKLEKLLSGMGKMFTKQIGNSTIQEK